MIRWKNLLIPLGGALVAAGSVGVPLWDGSKQGLLVALSVIAASVLVRLARGLPFTTVDHYEVDEIRRLTRAVSQSIRALRALIVFVFFTMFFVVFGKTIDDYASSLPHLVSIRSYIDSFSSGSLGFMLSYVVIRMLQVVDGDRELSEMQSTFVVRAVERKQAKRFDDQQSDGGSTFKAPESYGRLIQ